MFSRSDLLSTAAGVGLSAGLLYFLDPASGSRRRAQMRNRVTNTARGAGERVGGAIRDARDRARDLVYDARTTFTRGEVSAERLAHRVRSRLRRAVMHPSVIEVRADDHGTVTLSGPVLASEVHDLLRRVAGTRGVHEVNNFLDPHLDPLHENDSEHRGRAQWNSVTESKLWRIGAPVLAGLAAIALAYLGAQRMVPARARSSRLSMRLFRSNGRRGNLIGRGVRQLFASARH